MKTAIETIPGRKHLLKELNKRINLSQKKNNSLALVNINLLQFRNINAEFGYNFTDNVLLKTYNQLNDLIQDNDFVARTGDKEFTLVLTNIMGEGQGILAINRIIERFKDPVSINGRLLKIRLAFGMSMYPENSVDALELWKFADSALSFARETRQAYIVYSDIENDDKTTQFAMEADLEKSINNNDICYYYQPKINLADRTISGFEVLSRWTSERLGVIRPDIFIDLAEKTGLIGSLTVQCIASSLRNINELQQKDSNYTLAINLSAHILNNPETTELITNSLKIWCSKPEQLTLEVTEGAIMNNPQASLKTLSFLHEMGIKLSIDDFGTGYSSLAYLKKLPVDELKIDKSFVLEMLKNKDDLNIAKTVIGLAQNFSLKTVAEGVENEATLNELKILGCDIAQGFHIGKPMPWDELIPWIINWNAKL